MDLVLVIHRPAHRTPPVDSCVDRQENTDTGVRLDRGEAAFAARGSGGKERAAITVRDRAGNISANKIVIRVEK